MRQLDGSGPTLTAILALLISARDGRSESTEVVLARAGLTAEEIAALTGRAVPATPKPLPAWAEQVGDAAAVR
jgi:hypothetical protein